MLAPSLLPSAGQLEAAAALERATASPAMASALVEALVRTDIRSVLPQVAVPTLVIHRRGDLIKIEHGRYLAQHIPGAEYVELGGADHLPWAVDTEAVLVPIERFVRRFGGQRRAARTGGHAPTAATKCDTGGKHTRLQTMRYTAYAAAGAAGVWSNNVSIKP